LIAATKSRQVVDFKQLKIHSISPTMLAQQRTAGPTRSRDASQSQRPFGCVAGRAVRHTSIARALPLPQQDVIGKSDADAVCSLEERFKMADIDG
jgi:hypothetical protein